MSGIFHTLRHHRHFIVIVGVLAVLMTWPALLYVFDSEVFWLPGENYDLWMKFWDAWYGQALLAGEAQFYSTDLLFYPRSVSLVYHNFNIPHMLVFGGLQAVMPASNAYNLTYLILVFSVALSAYVYLLYLFRDKWISLLGAVIFGFSTHVVGHPQHPDISLIATLPLAAYCFHRGILEWRWKWIVLSGILMGLTAFIGMYIFVCILLTIGMYILYFALSRWRNPNFWLRIILLFFIVGSISMPRIYPMIHNTEDLNEALEKKGIFKDKGSDLLAYFFNSRHPITRPIFESVYATTPQTWSHTSYLGYVPLILIGLGFSRAAYRRKMLPWLMLSLPFVLLRLGTVLTINGQTFSDILLPKHHLDEMFPAIFKAFHVADHFQIGILLPLGVLSCYGLMAMMKSVSARRRPWIILILVALAAFEAYQSIGGEQVISDQQLEFVQWLEEEEEDSIRLIHLPMGRTQSKYYGFLQTLHGYPHAEGLASRTPYKAYDYIGDNLLLNNWRGKSGIPCSLSNQADYLRALDKLLDDGFSHIVVHDSWLVGKRIRILESFVNVQPSYEDEFATVYRLENLRHSCPS